MKKALVTSILSMASIIIFAQGAIGVGNGISPTRFPIYGPQLSDPSIQVVGNGPLSAPTGSTVFTGALLSGTQYVIEFWAGPSSAADFSGLTLLTTTTFRTAAVATALPNGITLTSTMNVPGVPAGLAAKLGVRVWDVTTGADYASATIKGAGALFTSAPLGGVDGNGGLVLSPNWVGQSFSIVVVPEPTTVTLVSMGSLLALTICRRKRRTSPNIAV